MDDIDDLLDRVKQVVRDATGELCDAGRLPTADYGFSTEHPREMKAAADRELEERILHGLAPTALPVLSEERGESTPSGESALRFVVDPLDGTVNFIRSLGPSAVSIALCRGSRPVFGVIGMCPGRELAWGGRDIGAFVDGRPVRVSRESDRERAVLCTGFPTRFRVGDDARSQRFARTLNRFGKVRMLGSAAVSLVQVARGAAEAYSEKDIMLWDVAAGIAIVEGAGGSVRMASGSQCDSFDVEAWNGHTDPGEHEQ